MRDGNGEAEWHGDYGEWNGRIFMGSWMKNAYGELDEGCLWGVR